MRYLIIENFKKHQHYKDRRPPWIKLHVEVLDDYAFGCLQDASKAHLMLLWVLASKHDNKIPYDLTWIAQQINSNTPVDVQELVTYGFISVSEDDSKPLAFRKQSAMPETETEAERETDKKKKRSDAGASAPSKSESKLDILSQHDAESLRLEWSKHFGGIEYPRFRKAILPVFSVPIAERPSASDVREAIVAYREWWEEQDDRDQGFWGLEKFVATVAKWIRFGKMPIAEGGVETERGKWAGSKRMRQEERRLRAS